MEQSAIFQPMLGVMLLTAVVWVYMFARRIPWITRSNLGPEDFRPQRFMELQPPEVAAPSDNLKNLFEMPVLFYALCLYLFVTQSVDWIHVVSAWVFLAFRVLHSLMHCTINIVIVRFWLYAVACLACFVMLARALLGLL